MQQRQSSPTGLGRPSSRHERGFTFIEILVVMGIITVLMSMVVVVIPMMNERSSRTKSQDNLRNLSMFFQARTAGTTAKWPSYDGKNFTLAPLTFGDVSAKNPQQLALFFSPGDVKYKADEVNYERYKEVTKDNLKNDVDFHELTSYAGRRNSQDEFRLTPNRIQEGAIILCDDDDGPLHHVKGLCVAAAGGGVRFAEWDEFGMTEPDEPDNPERFLADEATNDELRALSSSH